MNGTSTQISWGIAAVTFFCFILPFSVSLLGNPDDPAMCTGRFFPYDYQVIIKSQEGLIIDEFIADVANYSQQSNTIRYIPIGENHVERIHVGDNQFVQIIRIAESGAVEIPEKGRTDNNSDDLDERNDAKERDHEPI